MLSKKHHSISSDLEELLEASGDLWDSFRGANLFITGGTGFFGRWLLESFLLANKRKGLGASITVLSRNPSVFLESAPHFKKESALKFWQGDVRNFVLPAGTFTHLIHAAAESSGQQKHHNSLHEADTIVGGTRRVLDFARDSGVTRMLYISSGSIYGRNQPTAVPISENSTTAPLMTDSSIGYDESKRMAEALCVLYNREFGLPVSIARCFAFVGPYLPLDEHFAIGNFINNAIKNEPIRVNSSGTAARSYLYASDLVRWLWTILARGDPAQAYNVGSDQAISIADLAHIVQKTVNPNVSVEIAGVPAQNTSVNYQVPDIKLAQKKLGLRPLVSLEDAIMRTAAWYQENSPGISRTPHAANSVIALPDAIVFDFDGVMTDNRVLVFQDKSEAVLCNRADGLGIAMLHACGIPMLVLSTEKNPVVAARCHKLGLECLQGIDTKEEALATWLAERGYAPARTIYVGNDCNDLGCLRLVGCPVVVSDAHEDTKAVAQMILSRPGGKGAVRELADIVCAAHALPDGKL